MKAKHDFKNDNFNRSNEGFEKLVKNTELSTKSDYYNFAVSSFQVFLKDGAKD